MISLARNDLGSLLNVVFVVKKCVPPTFNFTQLFEHFFCPPSRLPDAIFGNYGRQPASGRFIMAHPSHPAPYKQAP